MLSVVGSGKPDKVSVEDGFTVVHNAQELRDLLDRPGRQEYVPIVDLLLSQDLITPEQLRRARQELHDDYSGRQLLNTLTKLGYLQDNDRQRLMMRYLDMPWVKLREFDVAAGISALLPVDVARQRHVMPLAEHAHKLVVAVEDPFDSETVDLLHFVTGRTIELAVASREDIEFAIGKYYGTLDVADVMEEMSASHHADPEVTTEDILRMGQERPIVRFVHNMILDAINRRASDIHVRPREKDVELFYRIDGSLVRIRTVDHGLLPAIVSRIKIFGGMNIAERRVPQDGRAKMRQGNSDIDLRISVLPSIHGESVVIRILDTSSSLRTLDQVGFSGPDADRFVDMLNRSHGMILVTGPTGSGKSTTLYAALQELRKLNVNIITVEDPVEYHIDGIVQIQVNTATGYTFARALRHILRHDPDAIMVGEIRDEETAHMAVESSLTGHVVLSTLHTNSAAASVTRLLEIGIEPYLLNTSLLGVLAQRLIRLNCPHCKAPEVVPDMVRRSLGIDGEEAFWRGKGCDNCYGSGYRGRRAVYELLQVTPALRQLIVTSPSLATLEQQATADGMVPLTDFALGVARAGDTSLEEVYRIRLQ